MKTSDLAPYPASFSLAHKVVVLTGGAGLYGRPLARSLSDAGAILVLASRHIAALEKVAAELTALGRTAQAVAFDQASEESGLRLRDAVLEKFGRVDGLVNNAVARPMHSPDAPLADWEASMKVNATGLFAVTRAFGVAMAERQQGAIVNIGSIYGVVGPDHTLYEGLDMMSPPDYFFHKGGLLNLTRFFAAQLGLRGVRVNYVSPGGFYNGQDPTFVARYARSTFLRRMADDHDLGGPVVFLLSDAARYVTGVNLAVDGGYTAH